MKEVSKRLKFQDNRVRDIGVRVMNEIVAPMRAIRIDATEFACLKAIVVFDPNAKGLKDVDKIKRLRHQIQVRSKSNQD